MEELSIQESSATSEDKLTFSTSSSYSILIEEGGNSSVVDLGRRCLRGGSYMRFKRESAISRE